MSEAIELYKKDGKAAGVWYCSECRVVFATEQGAAHCHGAMCECGQPIKERYQKLCRSCTNAEWNKRSADAEAAKFEASEKVTEADYDGEMVYDNDHYYESVEEAIDSYLVGQEPEYVWAVKNVGVPKADSESIVEHMLEHMWEDADSSDIKGLDALDSAVAAFNEANKDIKVWFPDYTKAVLVSRDEVRRRDGE